MHWNLCYCSDRNESGISEHVLFRDQNDSACQPLSQLAMRQRCSLIDTTINASPPIPQHPNVPKTLRWVCENTY